MKNLMMTDIQNSMVIRKRIIENRNVMNIKNKQYEI